MPDELGKDGIELKLGIVAGELRGVKDAMKVLSDRFEDHIKNHRATWLWVIPTIISLATLIFLILSCRM